MKTKLFLFFLLLVAATQLKANNMLVKNVTTTGDNAANKTIQVQFDMSWDNSWRDAINWDAAWVFMKYKDANGNWQHVQLNTTGFANGTGTANTIKVGSDKVGAFVYRSAAGTGTFSSTTMQLQWNYGLSGLTSVIGLEVRVFAVEMVYVPQGDFNCAKAFNNSTTTTYNGLVYKSFTAPGNNFPVITNRLSPSLTYNDGTSATIRIKGDAGVDSDNNGIVDNSNYPTGYMAFYCYKFELSENQYTDFLNTLTSSQITTLGIAGSNITLNNGQYFSSTPYKACGNSTEARLLAYADWSCLRPMSFLEFNKASYGPIQPVYFEYKCYAGYPVIMGFPAWGGGNGGCNYGGGSTPQLSNVGSFGSATSTRLQSGASYYGVFDLTGNSHEPVVKLNYFSYQNFNGNGILTTGGNADVVSWNVSGMITFIDMICSGLDSQNDCRKNVFHPAKYGFRYVRSVE